AASAASTISGAFITPSLLHYQQMEYVPYAIFTATIVIAKIAFSPMLGRMMHRIGVQRVLARCAAAIAAIPIMYMLSESYWWLLFIQFYGGIAWGGFELGVLIVLFDCDDDAERTTMQVAYGGLLALGNTSASLLGGGILAALGSGHEAYLWVFLVSAIARFAAALLVVRNLPRLLIRLPGTMIVSVWTMALRPWGGTIVRPIIEGTTRAFEKLRR
ncbi:MAG TPA: MFS transporter, partial [Kofleriaceae bacterium]|nr:MFS transporter [Kofleriaceae bacterium]